MKNEKTKRHRVCDCLCRSRNRWLTVSVLLLVSISGAVAALRTAPGSDVPTFAGRLAFESLRVQVKDAAYLLDPESEVATVRLDGQDLATRASDKDRLDVEFAPPARGAACDGFTLSTVAEPALAVAWTPRMWKSATAHCQIQLSWESRETGQRGSKLLRAGQTVQFQRTRDRALFSELLASGVGGRVPDGGLRGAPELVSKIFGLQVIDALGRLDIWLSGELYLGEIAPTTLDGTQQFVVRISGGELKEGKLGTNDLGERLRSAVREAFWREFFAMLVIFATVLTLLLTGGWDPCKSCQKQRRAHAKDEAAA